VSQDPNEYKKATLALLLCTLSTVHAKFVAGADDQVIALLKPMGLASLYQALLAKWTKTGAVVDRQRFTQVAVLLAADWDGNPPHPNDTVAANIATTLGAYDHPVRDKAYNAAFDDGLAAVMSVIKPFDRRPPRP